MNKVKIKDSIEITNEDCMDLMSRYPDNHFDLAIVDPPYRDVNKPDQWLRANAGDMKKWAAAPKEDYFKELMRVSKNQIIWGGNYFTSYLPANNNWILWWKLNEGVHFSMAEMAWSSIRKNIQLKKMNPNKNKIHPTEKPYQLYQWIIEKWAKEGNKILDTHLGSGSIAIALDSVNKIEKMNLTLTGCELDEDYFKAATKRIKEQTSWQSLFKDQS